MITTDIVDAFWNSITTVSDRERFGVRSLEEFPTELQLFENALSNDFSTDVAIFLFALMAKYFTSLEIWSDHSKAYNLIEDIIFDPTDLYGAWSIAERAIRAKYRLIA